MYRKYNDFPPAISVPLFVCLLQYLREVLQNVRSVILFPVLNFVWNIIGYSFTLFFAWKLEWNLISQLNLDTIYSNEKHSQWLVLYSQKGWINKIKLALAPTRSRFQIKLFVYSRLYKGVIESESCHLGPGSPGLDTPWHDIFHNFVVKSTLELVEFTNNERIHKNES